MEWCCQRDTLKSIVATCVKKFWASGCSTFWIPTLSATWVPIRCLRGRPFSRSWKLPRYLISWDRCCVFSTRHKGWETRLIRNKIECRLNDVVGVKGNLDCLDNFFRVGKDKKFFKFMFLKVINFVLWQTWNRYKIKLFNFLSFSTLNAVAELIYFCHIRVCLSKIFLLNKLMMQPWTNMLRQIVLRLQNLQLWMCKKNELNGCMSSKHQKLLLP